jgi:hypothetical protein
MAPERLTDITFYVQTPDDLAEVRRRIAERRFDGIDDLKSAVTLHFGNTRVRFSTSTRCIDLAQRQFLKLREDALKADASTDPPKRLSCYDLIRHPQL